MSSLFKNTLMVAVFTLGSRLLGFVREILYAAFYGTTYEMDAFLIANLFPGIMLVVLQTAIISSFIPVYNKYLVSNDRENADQFFVNSLVLVMIITGLFTTISIFLMPQIIALFAPGYNQDQLDLTVNISRLLMPTVFLSSILYLLTAVQQAQKKFFYPALALLVSNIIAIIITYLFNDLLGIYAVVLASLLAMLLQNMLQIPGVWKFQIKFSFQKLSLINSDTQKMWLLMYPLILSSVISQINIVIDRYLASLLPTGSISSLFYAYKINTVFNSLIGTSIITVMFPVFTNLFAENKINDLKKRLNLIIRVIMFVVLPLILILIFYSREITELLLRRGKFDYQATIATAGSLFFFSFGMLSVSLLELLNNVFYAKQDSKTPFKISLMGVIVYTSLSLFLMQYLFQNGLALAHTLTVTINLIVLISLLHNKIGNFNYPKIVTSFSKMALSGLAMILSFWGSDQMFEILIGRDLFSNKISELFTHLVFTTVIGGFCYLMIAFLLKSEEMQYILSFIIRMVFKKKVKVS